MARLSTLISAALLAATALSTGTAAQAATTSAKATPKAAASSSASTTGGSGSTTHSSSTGHTSGKLDPRATARQQARRTGKPVQISALTTADSTTTANANGTFTDVTTPLPTRAENASGAWQDIDTNLVRHADGTVGTIATPDSLVLSGGGRRPLATLADSSGHSFSLSPPVSLPAPKLSGATATYTDIRPGLDLVVTALQTGGFREVVVVRNAAAAAAAKHLAFTTTLNHLTMRADASGNLQAVDPATGKTVISAPPAALWDSATGASASKNTPEDGTDDLAASASSSAVGPGRGAHTARMPITLSAGSLSLDGDAAALLGKKIEYPVFLDPTWTLPTFSGGTQAYDEVQSGCPGYENINLSGMQPGVGEENIYNPCAGIYRAYYTVDTSGVNAGDTISNATLKLTEDYSALDSCSQGSETITAYWTAPISGGTGGTSWSNMPSIDQRGDPITSAVSDSVGNSNGHACAGGTLPLDLNFTGAAVRLAASNSPSLTFGLYGNEATGSQSLQRFTENPALDITYDIAPNTPSAAQLSTSPAPHTAYNATEGCVESYNGYVNRSSLDGANAAVLSATLTSNVPSAQLYGDFQFYDHNTNTDSYVESSAYVGSGATVSVESPPLVDGHVYDWQVESSDQYYLSGWSDYCSFTADLMPPTNPVVASTDYPASGSGKASGKYAGEPGTFALSSTDPAPGSGTASGLAGFYYSLDTPIPATGGTFTSASTVSLTPATWGIHTLYVQAVDNADNVSAQTQYTFFVPWNPATKVVPGDISGDGVPDLVTTTGSGNLVEYRGDSDPGTAPAVISTPSYSPGGDSWSNYDVTHRGSFSNQGVDDLWAFDNSTHQLYLYKNINHEFENTSQVTTISKSEVATEANTLSTLKPDSASTACATTSTGSCTGYDNGDWGETTQILAVGDLYAGSSLDNGTGGLLTVENGALWYYQGHVNPDYIGTAVQLGTSGWNNVTLIAPGLVNGKPVLWARDNASGAIYSYNITFDGSGVPENLGTPTTKDAVLTVAVGTGLGATHYPTVLSPGDLHGTGDPDLVTVTANGEVTDFPGTAPSGTGATFGEPVALGDPSTSAATSSVSFPSDGTFYANGSVWTTTKNTLTFDDGTLTVTDTATGDVLAAYGPSTAYPDAVLVLQTDGNLASYSDYLNAVHWIWAVNETGDAFDSTTGYAAGDKLTLESGGNLDLTTSAGSLIWGSGTIGNQDAGSGFCLDADADSAGRDGAIVQLWGCNGTAQQNWTIALNTGTGGYQIQNSLAGQTFCLDGDASNMGVNGTKVQLWTCNSAAQQQWPATLGSGGTYVVHNGNSAENGFCVDADTDTIGQNGTKIQLWTCNSASEQNWIF